MGDWAQRPHAVTGVGRTSEQDVNHVMTVMQKMQADVSFNREASLHFIAVSHAGSLGWRCSLQVLPHTVPRVPTGYRL
jgi:hypothetical protein